jgi:uncharacterized membrane protein YfcA
MWEILLPIFGFLIGTVAALTGIGGGVFIVPLLTLFYALQPANAAGTSLTTIIFTAVAATLNYVRQKRIYYKTGLILAITTAPGAFLGAYLTTVLAARELGLIFGFFLIFVAMRMLIDLSRIRSMYSNKGTAPCEAPICSDNELLESTSRLLTGATLSFFGGLASGLLGIGGGVLLVPIMTLVMEVPIHVATATSMFTMMFTSASGVTQHYMANHISLEYVLPLALGTILGAQLGAYTSKRLSAKYLRAIFGAMLLVVGIQMILKYL